MALAQGMQNLESRFADENNANPLSHLRQIPFSQAAHFFGQGASVVFTETKRIYKHEIQLKIYFFLFRDSLISVRVIHVELEFEMLVLGKPEYLSEQGREPNSTRATLVGGKCSQHCAISAHHILLSVWQHHKTFLSVFSKNNERIVIEI